MKNGQQCVKDRVLNMQLITLSNKFAISINLYFFWCLIRIQRLSFVIIVGQGLSVVQISNHLLSVSAELSVASVGDYYV